MGNLSFLKPVQPDVPPEEQFRKTIQDALGSAPAELVADGMVHRFHCSCKASRNQNGWYLFHADEPANGRFACHKHLQEPVKWCSKEYKSLTAEEKSRYAANVEAARKQQDKERERIQAECRTWCADAWKKAKDATAEHPYLVRKAVKSYGLKQFKDSLLVPVRSLDGRLHGLQIISPDGSKKFKTGTVKRGHVHMIGKPIDDTLFICEGYATGATIHEATGHAVLVAFDNGNMKAVAECARSKRPGWTLIIAADDDHATEGNPGLTKATDAAQAVNGLLARPDFPDVRESDITDFNDLASIAGLEEVARQLQAAIAEPIQQNQDSPFISGTALFDIPTNPAYLVHKLIEENSTGMLFGPSGGGKTFNALDFALSVATGLPWAGRATKRGLVIYLTGEGYAGLPRRLKAKCKYHEVAPADLSLFHVSRGLTDLADTAEIVTAVRAIVEATGKHPVLIVVDTLARHLDGDENSAKDMGAFIAAVDALRLSFPGSVGLIIHHTGHGEDTKTRGRGSSVLRAAMDFEILCDRGLLTFTKMKDAETPPSIEFKLLPVEIGADHDGQPVTSCVVVYGERTEQHKAGNYTGGERQAITALVNASSCALRVEEDGQWGALIGDWRQAFYDLRRSKDPDLTVNTLKQAFKRASEKLVTAGAVQEIGHVRLLTSDAHQGEVRTAINLLAGVQGT